MLSIFPMPVPDATISTPAMIWFGLDLSVQYDFILFLFAAFCTVARQNGSRLLSISDDPRFQIWILLTDYPTVLYLLLLRVWWFIKAISFIWVMILYFLITRPLENSLMLLRKCKCWSYCKKENKKWQSLCCMSCLAKKTREAIRALSIASRSIDCSSPFSFHSLAGIACFSWPILLPANTRFLSLYVFFSGLV